MATYQLIQLVCGHMQMSQMSLIKEIWPILPEIPRFQVFPHCALNARCGEQVCAPKKEFKLLVSLFIQKHLSTTEQEVTTEDLVLSSAHKELAI